MKVAEGMRTFTFGLVCLAVLMGGFSLLATNGREAVFAYFVGAIVGLMGAQAGKSVATSAVKGDGLKGGIENLLTDKKPGDPPVNP
jgi:hypothetical protein